MLRPQPVEINVTKKDIDQGVCKDAEMCAIALALEREYKSHINYVQVEHYDNIKMSNDNEDLWYRVNICPDDDVKVHEFMKNFDDGKKVKPFSFNINEIEEF